MKTKRQTGHTRLQVSAFIEGMASVVDIEGNYHRNNLPDNKEGIGIYWQKVGDRIRSSMAETKKAHTERIEE